MIVLGLGSNQGERRTILRQAVKLLEAGDKVHVRCISGLYETDPVGNLDQPQFLNAVAVVETELSPGELLQHCLAVEQQLGRVRGERWGPRTIDVDLLLYGGVQMAAADLEIPHPRLAERKFVLAPLAEIAPEALLPGGKTAQELLMDLQDGFQVCRIGDWE